MRYFLKMVGGFFVICGIFGHGWAFDGDYEINLPNFNQENFLDIKAYQLSPQLQTKWYETRNGIQIVGGSLGLDFLYLATEIKVEQPLNGYITVKYHLKREEFYAIKPLRQQIDLEFRFLENYALAVIGFPAYDKRVAELGAAFTWGKPPWHYLRVFHLEQAPFYNEKNFEADRFIQEPVKNGMEGAYGFFGKWSLRFHGSRDSPLEHYFPKQQLTFKYQGEEAGFTLEYSPSPLEQWGLTSRGFDFKKSRTTPLNTQNKERQRQTLQYISHDFYWARPIFSTHTVTLGTRYDRLRNLFRNLMDTNESFDYLFNTWQVYGVWLQPVGDGWNLDYGLYMGQSYEEKDYLSSLQEDIPEESTEAKLRVSLELYNDNNGHLFFTTTWNLDTFFNNFWDGGNIAYQTQF